MRLLSLHLDRFGPFADLHLDLSAGREGLHLLYGPNEAGKTSTRRALHHLLFGFPHQSSDDWQFDSRDLRISAHLRGSNGQELRLARRKGRKDTLLDAHGSPLPDSALDPFLSGLGAKVYETTFSLGHAELVKGGAELLAGEGELGSSLFAAALGGGGPRTLLRELNDKRDLLYTPRASTRRINQLLSRHKELAQLVSRSSLAGSEWESVHTDLRKAQAEVNAQSEARDAAMREVARLQRLRRAAPKVAAWREANARRTELGPVPRLERTARDERLEALRVIGDETTRLQADRASLDELTARLDAERVPDDLLAQAEEIEELHRELGSFDARERDLPRKRHDVQEGQERVRRELDRLYPSMSLDQLERGLPRPQQKRVRELAKQRGVRQSEVEASRRELDRARVALEQLAPVEAPPEALPRLRLAVHDVTASGLSERAIAKQQSEVDTQAAGLNRLADRLTGWSGDPRELDALVPPTAETISHVANELTQLARRRDEHLADRDRRQAERDALHKQITEDGARGEVPTQEVLRAARDARDADVEQVVALWERGTAAHEEPARHGLGALRRSILRADQLADERYDDAEVIGRHEERLASRHVLDELLDRLRTSLTALDADRASVLARWAALWAPAGITPADPAEMLGWLTRWEQAHKALDALRAADRELVTLQASWQAQRDLLCAALRAVGIEPGSSPLDQAREALVRFEEQVLHHARQLEVRADLAGRVALHTRELRERETALATWTSEWAEALAAVGLADTLHPEEAEEILSGLEELRGGLDKLTNDRRRVEAMERDEQDFQAHVLRVLGACAPELREQPAREAIQQLRARLTAAQQSQTRRAQWEVQITELRKQITTSETRLLQHEQRLRRLCEQAGVTTPEALPEREEASATAQELDADLKRLAHDLLADGDGASLESLITEVETTELDALPGRLAHQQDAAKAAGEALQATSQRVGELRARLAGMDGGQDAARAAEELAQVEAELDEGATEYLKLQLAHALLTSEIERHRREQQGPMLQRASEVFARLTLGSFTHLEPDYDGDKPILLGVRANGRRVAVDGMSDGTRDQLYLALRLASLDLHARAGETTPLIVDDVLIQFDQARAGAALEAFAELSNRCQVLFFTHDESLVRIAESLGRSTQVFVHRLG